MKLKTIIIDDEPIALEKLKNYVGKIPNLQLAAACQSGFEAMEFLASNEADLIITDINMPDLTGLDFIKSLSAAPMVIFTTAYPQYAVDSYKVSAVDYLLKPYSFVDFSRAVSKAVEVYISRQNMTDRQSVGSSQSKGESLFVKVDFRYVRIDLSDIRFIKGYGEYLQIYISDKDTPLLTLSSFASIKDRLSDDFLQVHRSYIANMNHVSQIERNRLTMDDGTIIPVSDSYKASFLEYLSSHAIGKATK